MDFLFLLKPRLPELQNFSPSCTVFKKNSRLFSNSLRYAHCHHFVHEARDNPFHLSPKKNIRFQKNAKDLDFKSLGLKYVSQTLDERFPVVIKNNYYISWTLDISETAVYQNVKPSPTWESEICLES